MPRLFMQYTPYAYFEREMMAKPGFGLRRICEDGMMYPIHEYRFPLDDGCFVGTLVRKKWNNSNGLNCFFDTVDGHPYKLCAWNSHDSEGYCPACSDLDVSLLPIGTMLKVKYRITRSGKCKWLEAEVVHRPPRDRNLFN